MLCVVCVCIHRFGDFECLCTLAHIYIRILTLKLLNVYSTHTYVQCVVDRGEPLYVGMRTVASSRQQQILVLTSFVNHHRRSVCVGMCVYECVCMSVCGYTSIVKIYHRQPTSISKEF